MTFPVVLKTAVQVEPRAAIYYEIAANGTYQVRTTPLYRAVTRAEGPVPGLVPESEHLLLRVPPLARADIEDVLAFFDEAYRRYRGEAIVLLFYRDATREYRIDAPPQTLPGRQWRDGRWCSDRHAIRYRTVARPAGFIRFGSIHSHAELPAYASSQDCADESHEDGLHIVFGGFGTAELSVVASFVANGVRFALPAADVLEPHARPEHAARPEWMPRLTREDDEYEGDMVVPFLPSSPTTEEKRGSARASRRGGA